MCHLLFLGFHGMEDISRKDVNNTVVCFVNRADLAILRLAFCWGVMCVANSVQILLCARGIEYISWYMYTVFPFSTL